MITEQPLDVRAFWLRVRRHRRSLLLSALAGALLLAALAVVHPPAYSSTSQVLLPPPPTSNGQQTERDPATYVAVATSESVLGPVAKREGTTVRALKRTVSVDAASQDVLAITASAADGARAERIAHDAATSLVAYLADATSSLSNAQRDALDGRIADLAKSQRQVRDQIAATKARAEQQSPTSADGRATANALAQLTAQQARLALSIDDLRKQRASGLEVQSGAVTDQARIIQDASAAHRTAIPVWVAIAAAIGALLGLTLALLVGALLARRRRRLWSRDALADAIGSPVLASVSGRTPRSVGGWTSLLAGYQPSAVDAWAWRQLLREHVFADRAHDDSELHLVGPATQRRLLVVALADDPAAIAAAAQVASYAASVAVNTRFVAGQRHPDATRLWAAAGRAAETGSLRPGLYADASPQVPTDDDLIVTVAVLDRAQPALEPQPVRSDCVVVAVSPGTTTGEELATLAVALDDGGCSVDGLVVTDADTVDRTTGKRSAESGGGRRASRISTAHHTSHDTGHHTGQLTSMEPALDGPSATVLSVAGRRRKP